MLQFRKIKIVNQNEEEIHSLQLPTIAFLLCSPLVNSRKPTQVFRFHKTNLNWINQDLNLWIDLRDIFRFEGMRERFIPTNWEKMFNWHIWLKWKKYIFTIHIQFQSPRVDSPYVCCVWVGQKIYWIFDQGRSPRSHFCGIFSHSKSSKLTSRSLRSACPLW